MASSNNSSAVFGGGGGGNIWPLSSAPAAPDTDTDADADTAPKASPKTSADPDATTPAGLPTSISPENECVAIARNLDANAADRSMAAWPRLDCRKSRNCDRHSHDGA
jgi:hypothetical protein